MLAAAFLAFETAIERIQLGQPRVEQAQPLALAVAVHAGQQFVQLAAFAPHVHQPLVRRTRWTQGLDLLARGDHRLVRFVQLGEFGHQAIGHGEGFRALQHEVAQEVVEVAQVLRRLGLVQQPQRGVVADAEQAAETFGVGVEAVVVVHVGQALLEPAQVQVETLQFGGQVERPFGDDEMLLHVGGGGAVAANPQQPHQGHAAAQRVAVFQRQRRPHRAAAQVLGGDLA